MLSFKEEAFKGSMGRGEEGEVTSSCNDLSIQQISIEHLV